MDDADKAGAPQGRARDWRSCQGNALARGILKTLKYCPQKAAETRPKSHSTRQRQSWGRSIGHGARQNRLPPKMGPSQGKTEKTMLWRTPLARSARCPRPPAAPTRGAVLTFLCSSLEDACILPRGKEFKIGAVCFCGSRREIQVMIWKLLG